MKLLLLVCLICCCCATTYADEEKKLLELKPEAQKKIRILLKQARSRWPEYDIVVAETYRSQEKQDKLFKKGRTMTVVRISMHTKRLAADIYFTNGKRILEYEEAPYLAMGEMAEKLGLTWGGRWKVPFDPGHYELR